MSISGDFTKHSTQNFASLSASYSSHQSPLLFLLLLLLLLFDFLSFLPFSRKKKKRILSCQHSPSVQFLSWLLTWLPCVFESEGGARKVRCWMLLIWESFSLCLPGGVSHSCFCPQIFPSPPQTSSKVIQGPRQWCYLGGFLKIQIPGSHPLSSESKSLRLEFRTGDVKKSS